MKQALILIDIQKGFDDPFWGQRNNLDAEENAAQLLRHWRAKNRPIFHVRHLSTSRGSPLLAGSAGAEFNPLVAPLADETVIEKNVNSAFIGTDLQQQLHKNAITVLVICGLTTPHCVSTTARMAANLGFNVILAHDACAAFTMSADTSWNPSAAALNAQQIHDSAISHLHGEFVRAQSTNSILGTDL